MGNAEYMGVKPNSPVLKDVETLPLPLPRSGCPCQCNPCGGEGLLQVPVLLHLPSCQLRLQHQLHLWRTTLTCAQIFPVLSANAAGRSLQPEKSEPAVEEPMERGFFRFQCYGTCSAAAFASTTSCTFGGLFWRTTLTCAQIFPVLAANQG